MVVCYPKKFAEEELAKASKTGDVVKDENENENEEEEEHENENENDNANNEPENESSDLSSHMDTTELNQPVVIEESVPMDTSTETTTSSTTKNKKSGKKDKKNVM